MERLHQSFPTTIAVILTLIAVTTLCATAETPHNVNPPDTKIETLPSNETRQKIYVGSDPIIENFGAREAPYEGFLVFPKAILPNDYDEKSHHYTKIEYLISFKRISNNVAYTVDITESDLVAFFEPNKQNLVKEFSLNGCSGRVFAYREHLTEQPSLALYWLNPPKQRISISVQLDPAHPFSPDDLTNFLKAMTPATGIPALVDPLPKPAVGRPPIIHL